MKYINYKTVFIFLFFLVFTPKLVFGAQFIASSSPEMLHAGDQFQVDILVNTQGQDANAFGGTIVYPQNLLVLNEIRDGNSIVNFWVNAPTSTASGVIFSGITPGGYVGTVGEIFSLVFTAKAAGSGDVNIENGQLLRSDGSGDAIAVTYSNFSFSVSTSTQGAFSIVSAISDTVPPEAFVPEVSQDENLFGGKWFVAFAAQDKGSGIGKYEVRESTHRIFDFSKWNPAESPYLLTDQNLHSTIYVKAIDNAGNARVEIIAPRDPLPFYENLDTWFIIVIVLVFLFLYKKFLWEKFK